MKFMQESYKVEDKNNVVKPKVATPEKTAKKKSKKGAAKK